MIHSFTLIAGFLVALSLAHAARAEGPVTIVDDPAVLGALDAKGFGFAGVFAVDGEDDLKALYDESPAYHAIVDTVAGDVAALRAEMKAGGRPLYEVTDGNVGRVMDMLWLKTDAARFRLVGVINRLDRRDFADVQGESNCGEVRFIYRLAYSFRKKGKVLASRLPFNFSAVYSVAPDADGGCVGVAGRWTPQLDESVDAGWLVGGPLEKAGLSFKQLELNAQVVRFPSGQETEFGGQAAYLMRIFDFDGAAIAEMPLENTPDTARLAEDAALKKRLADYISDNVAAVDLGIYEIPDEFLAKKVISWSTFGSARQANHPFTPLFQPTDFAGLDYSGLKLVRTPEALVERLDNGACQGCHQAGSTAGFHFIGLDDRTTSPLNRIEVGISPHLHADIPRRQAWLRAMAEGKEPNRFRPLSFAPPAAWTDAGEVDYAPAEMAMPCLVPEDAARFGATWQCGGGTVCTPLATASGVRTKLAQCLLPKDSKDMFSGHPCLTGSIASNATRPFNDRYKITGQFAAFATDISRTAYTCRPPKIGVPAGIAYRGCDDKDRNFAAFKAGKPMPSEICGLVGGKKFDTCVATNNFDQCLGGAVNRGNRPACSADHFCREDYMCQSLPPDTPGVGKVKGIGFCSPTYFIFQMRIDNHATPWASAAHATMGAGFGAAEEE
ncbi:hypothetical protein D3227_17125 [Mesorhizobium waimense]|uniref:Cytochrome C n=1 Tax=Mesorhizobium waimense TaxID=1300307 RepID=A0A3A5KR43_9HYPH|nr:hypothetical protein [Mesorhizobium waimense]RJT38538.1 hypothetical protein D3227_17125 [Mesorhizobium waimense]